MRSVEVFSGAGGLAKGLELAGFEHAAFVEFNKHACVSLRSNFVPEHVYEGDIRNYDFNALSAVDVVAGGPPCQPFSLGGKHSANDDTRDMFPAATAAIETLAPKAFLFENVKGLLRQSFAAYFQYVINRLRFPDAKIRPGEDWTDHAKALQAMDFAQYEGLKYRVSYKLIDAADYGVPQCRERVVIVGIRSDIDVDWEFPQPTHSEQVLHWEKHVSGIYWERHGIPLGNREGVSQTLRDRAIRSCGRSDLFQPTRKAWLTVRDALVGVPDPLGSHGIVDHIYRGGARTYAGHTGSDIDLPAKTIKAGVHGVPGGENMLRFRDGSVRYFTVFEAKRIQTFPDDFVISGAWGEALRQIGNAVPVLLARKLGDALHPLVARTTVQPKLGRSHTLPASVSL
jgi:DNA (cytosine-5)-methyltransferase 1